MNVCKPYLKNTMAAAAVTMVVILVAVVSLWLQIIPSQAIKVKLVPRDFSHTSAFQGSVTSDDDYNGGVWSYQADLSDSDRVQRAIQRSRTREAAIQRRVQSLRLNAQVLDDDSTDQASGWSSNYKAPVSPGSGEFLLKISMGTPELEYEMILDTGSNLIWTQCEPCNNCFNQSSPIFDPTKSSSYQASTCDSDACNGLPEGQSSCSSNQCGYEYSYGDGSNTTGVMGTDTFKLSGTPLPSIAFGCGNDNNGNGFDQGAGLVGFGRGNLSLPMQFAQNTNADAVFAYCLIGASSGSSPMWLGSDATQAFPSNAKAVSTPLISNQNMDTFYYVTLTGIKVGNTPVDIPAGAFDIQSDGSGGLIVDSGTTLTYLESQTEQNLINALKSAINLNTADSSSVGLDLCYDSSSNTDNFPTVTFTFQGDADMEMTPSNYLIQQNNLLCVAFAAASGQGSVSILGNIAQMDFLVLYDTAQNKLSFAKTKCESLS